MSLDVVVLDHPFGRKLLQLGQALRAEEQRPVFGLEATIEGLHLSVVLGAAEKVVPTIVGFVSDGWIGPLIPSRDGLNREVYGLAGTRPRESGGERERES